MILFIQLGVALVIFLVSFLFSWYEGSAILQDPWEWKYSTPFSHMLHGEVAKANDISLLDHFVYAAKFHPLYPALMLLSGVYLLILIGWRLFGKRSSKGLLGYITTIGTLLLLLSIIMFNAYTSGGKLFFYLLVTSGILCLILSVFIYKRRLIAYP